MMTPGFRFYGIMLHWRYELWWYRQDNKI